MNVSISQINKTFPQKLFLFIFISCSIVYSAQGFQLKKDSELVKNYQIEVYGKTSQLFISENGVVDIPLENIHNAETFVIVDLDKKIDYHLYKEELKIKDSVLNFSSGKIIETVVINNEKKELLIGIEDKGGSSRLYILPDVTRMIEIPKSESYLDKKIKKIRYYFSSGRHPISGEKIDKSNTKIIAFMYTCESADCKNPQYLLPKTEVNFTGNGKYLEIDVSHRNLIIDENFKNIYVGFISLGNFVIKMKKAHKIGDNKCYNANEELQWFRQATYHCPVIFLSIE
ncbi:hypothetical protein [Chryseobacterium gwangjuense]|uniref:hypothetical protein n=1 Tax=Chryseobacterium gwangjuense TaxID=1069980 RepID=UPI001E60FF3A|nr:hypothetical protein [Chryseobacterium gwangjuense]MCE3077163.1 hypothetical protein [Chryseobacterium gwangjuense]